MEPFRLVCTHCSSKVVVRHRHLLGQTLPCPKCKGPIVVPNEPLDSLVTARATNPLASEVSQAAPHKSDSPVRRGQPVVNSAAITKDGDPVWDDLFNSENFSIPSPTELDSIPFRSADATATPPREAESTPLVPLSTNASKFNQSWQSDKTKKRRQILMLSTIAGTGSLFAIVCFIAFIKFMGESPNSAPSLPQNNQVTAGEGNMDAGAESSKLAQANSAEAPNLGNETETPPNLVEPTTPLIAAEAPPVPPDPKATAGESAEKTGQPSIAFNSNDASPAAASQSDPEKEFASLFTQDMFKPILNGNRSTNPITSAPQAADDLDVESAIVDVGSVYHPMPKQVPTWEDRSKLQLNSIQMHDVSLLQCIDWIGRTTGVGITIDWQSLRAAGIDASKKMSFETERKTIGEMLASILEKQNLEWVLDPQGLPIVRAPIQLVESRFPADWTIASYVTTSNETEMCQQLIRLWGVENYCSYRNGSLIWTEQANPLDKANMISSLINLSLLQKREPETFDFQPLFSPALWQSSIQRLKKTVRKTTLAADPRPVPELLMTAASDIQVNLFIDWQHSWAHGLVPDEMAVSYLPGRTLPQIATRFLNNFGLELVPISAESVWLTTGDVRRKLIRVVPIPLNSEMKMDDLKQSLLPLAPLGPNDYTRYRVETIAGLPDYCWARICTPRVDQGSDTNLIDAFGWPKQ